MLKRLPVIFDAQQCFSWQYLTQYGYLKPYIFADCKFHEWIQVLAIVANNAKMVLFLVSVHLILGITTFGGFGGQMMLLGHPFCHGSSSTSGSL